jgi:hypothetical protein
MATVTKKVITGSSANTNNYTSGAFTPVVGDLLFVISHATGSIDSAPTCSASANGITFTRVARLEHTLSGNVSAIFVASQLVPSSPVSMTVTVAHPTDPATGCFVACGAVTGMTNVNSAAVLQSALSPNLAAGAAYTATFGSAVTSTNPVVGFVGWAGTVTITAPPTGWTEIDQPTPQATPTQAFEWASDDSGSTATAYTWTASGSTTRGNVAAIEFDASGGATNVNGDASLPVTDTVTSSGVVGAVAGAALALAVGVTAAGVVGTSTGASVSESVAISAAGSVAGSGVSAGATVAETATLTGAGQVGAATGSALPLTTTVTAAGQVGLSTGASLPLADAITAAGVRGTSTGTTAPTTATLTAAGIVGTATGASLASSASIVAAGSVAGSGGSQGASLPVSDAIVAAGVVGRQSGAALSETAALTSAGVVGKAASASVAPAVTMTAAGRVGLTTGSTSTYTVAITAAGTVAIPGALPPAPPERTSTVTAVPRGSAVIPAAVVQVPAVSRGSAVPPESRSSST